MRVSAIWDRSYVLFAVVFLLGLVPVVTNAVIEHFVSMSDSALIIKEQFATSHFDYQFLDQPPTCLVGFDFSDETSHM